jgi:hypothetical protein
VGESEEVVPVSRMSPAKVSRQLHADQHERQIDRRIADLEH